MVAPIGRRGGESLGEAWRNRIAGQSAAYYNDVISSGVSVDDGVIAARSVA